jgi:hypothetical protein
MNARLPINADHGARRGVRRPRLTWRSLSYNLTKIGCDPGRSVDLVAQGFVGAVDRWGFTRRIIRRCASHGTAVVSSRNLPSCALQTRLMSSGYLKSQFSNFMEVLINVMQTAHAREALRMRARLSCCESPNLADERAGNTEAVRARGADLRFQPGELMLTHTCMSQNMTSIQFV